MSSHSESAGPAAMVDRLLPGEGSTLDRSSQTVQRAIGSLAQSSRGRAVMRLLRGNDWVGHPAHPAVVVVPIGAWVVSAWYDARSARTRDPRDDHAADGALRVGVAGAVAAASTGVAQYLDTRNGVRRETAVHAGLNSTALVLYLASWALRARQQRRLARRLSAAALAVVGVGGYLGGDIAYRHGVGVRPQALADPGRRGSATSDEAVQGGGAAGG